MKNCHGKDKLYKKKSSAIAKMSVMRITAMIPGVQLLYNDILLSQSDSFFSKWKHPSWAKPFSGSLRATDGELMQMGEISKIISEIKEPNWSTQLSSKMQTVKTSFTSIATGLVVLIYTFFNICMCADVRMCCSQPVCRHCRLRGAGSWGWWPPAERPPAASAGGLAPSPSRRTSLPGSTRLPAVRNSSIPEHSP